MSTERKFYTLDDGRVLTIDEIMALTGVSKKTTWVICKVFSLFLSE